jgi:hypothetical protein
MNEPAQLERLLRDLSHKINSGYDFNADPEETTLQVSQLLSP